MSARSLIGMKLEDVYALLKRAGYEFEGFVTGKFDAVHETLKDFRIEYDGMNYVTNVVASW